MSVNLTPYRETELTAAARLQGELAERLRIAPDLRPVRIRKTKEADDATGS